MAITLSFKDVIDKPEWRPLAPSPNASAAGCTLIEDLRTSEDRHPIVYQLTSATVLNQYHIKNDGWSLCRNPGLTGTFGAGACGVMMPSRGPRGVVAANCSTTKIILSTALPAAVGINCMAGRGDGRGFKIRIIDNVAGGTGKVEERTIISNTDGTTPTIYLDSALSFTPSTGAAYEFLSGRVYMLSAGTMAAGCWKYYDILTNSLSGNLSITNLPATIGTDSDFVGLDEGYIPCDATVSTGFFDVCTVTAAAATSITVTFASALVASEIVNLQVRIVEDTTTPTAAGQRRRITANTAGTSSVLTVATWTVTPSSTAKVVIENVNDIVLFTSASTTTYTYEQEGNTWSTSTYGARGGAVGAGVMAFQPFGVAKTEYAKDPNKNFRWTTIHSFRGGAAVTLDILDLHAAAAGTWNSAVVYGSGPTFTTGSCLCYDGSSSIGKGKFAYINGNGTQVFYRYNAYTRQLNEWTYLRYSQGTAVVGNRLAMMTHFDEDGTTKLSFIGYLRSTGTELFDILAQR